MNSSSVSPKTDLYAFELVVPLGPQQQNIGTRLDSVTSNEMEVTMEQLYLTIGWDLDDLCN